MLVVVCAVLGVALACAIAGVVALLSKLGALKRRYAPIGNADAEAERIVAEATRSLAGLRSENESEMRRREQEAARNVTEAQKNVELLRAAVANETRRREDLVTAYATAKTTFDELQFELRALQGNLEDISFGLYEPQYSFDTPEKFKREIDRVRDSQKQMIRAGAAAQFAQEWTVGNSKSEGRKMQKQYEKLMLRAFNGECDAAVANVSWNNATRMEERIRKAFEAINDLGSVMTVSISPRYRDLKIEELRLEHELEEHKRAVVEEQRRIREQMKEEERAQREAEKAQAEAEAEETRYEKALEKARLELAKARGDEHARLNAKLVELQAQLEEAHKKKERAKSLAEMTRAGYVYVLSNIGSFGEGVFKIGMTRRLDPMDRVKELGDASVPFPFDVHAMVYCDDAPGLENALHQSLSSKSVNLVNMRKEFFRVGLDEVERLAVARGLKVSFTLLAEAREYRETVELRAAKERPPVAETRHRPTLPSALSSTP